MYFYHPDHLGSSSYITDKEGQVIQHTEYMAFGEILVDEHSVSNKQPYLFNGKELDMETGLYYYGARYYDPKVSIFLNVDPLVEKTGTPYAYTYNNPIRFIDPTGMEADDPPSKSLYEGQVYKDNTGVFIGGKDGIWKATRKDGTKEVLIPEVQLKGKSGATMASEARQRYYDAIANCSGCQQIEEVERFAFMYVPMAIATGGLSIEASAGVYATKASISIGTQVAINQDVNLVKLAGDTMFNPISGAVIGNSAEYNVSELIKGNFNSSEVSSIRNFGIGMGTDVLFMGRNRGYEKFQIPKSVETIIGVQSELASQSMSKGLQNKYGDKK